MNVSSNQCAVFTVLINLLLISFTSPLLADVNNYEFQLEQGAVQKGNDIIISARLLDKTTGDAVPDAVIFAKRIDMAPDAMATMDAPLEELPALEPGVYRFRTSLIMAGGWQLSLAAKIQGEEGTLESRLILKALP